MVTESHFTFKTQKYTVNIYYTYSAQSAFDVIQLFKICVTIILLYLYMML